MGRKEGAAGRQRGTTSTTQAHTDGRRGGDFEQEKKKKKEEKKEEKKEKSTLRRARTRRRGFFFAGVRWEGRGAGAGGESGWDGVGVERWRRRAVCGVLGRRTLGRGAISATSAHGLGRGKAGEEEAQAGPQEREEDTPRWRAFVRQKVWEGSD